MDAMSNSTPMSVSRISAAFDACDKADADWIETRVELALALQEGKQLCGDDNRRFSLWLAENGLDRVGRDDRAALLNIADHVDAFRSLAKENLSRSLQLIWRVHMEGPILLSAKNTASAPEMVSNAPKSAEIARSAIPAATGTGSGRKSPLLQLRGGEMIWNTFTSGNTRKLLNSITKHNARATPAWNFLVDCHTQLKTEPTDASIHHPTLRLIYPWLSGGQVFVRRYDITRKEDREAIKADIMPVIRDHEAELRQYPDRLAQLVDAQRLRRAKEFRDMQEAPKVASAVASMPTNQQEIIFCGKRLWPLTESEIMPGSGYDYVTLCFAIWYFRDWAQAIGAAPAYQHPGDLARAVRERLRFPREWSLMQDDAVKASTGRLWNAIRRITFLYEQTDGQGESRFPPPPSIIEGAVPSLESMPA